ncbi:Uncharacterised protein [Burkholderia pseudomallei]|nr:Uncharacterised protein [Burkholderia pseudomallei]
MAKTEIEGIRDGYMAFHEEDYITVLDSDGEGVFTLPCDLDVAAINATIVAYEQGWAHGHSAGVNKVRVQIREVLGL